MTTSHSSSAEWTAFYSINGGTRFEGVRASTHNSAQRRTRALFSGQGYRVNNDLSRVGHLVLEGPVGVAVIDTVRVAEAVEA